ncbi:MAG: hypothetical protein JWQ71_21 [Pedosphaera sp.]|nr:hypothetical protein [Pedosphaera sp.]
MRRLKSIRSDTDRVALNGNGNLTAPNPSQFVVTADGQIVSIQSVGFKRRVLYAPLNHWDLRIENHLYLQVTLMPHQRSAAAHRLFLWNTLLPNLLRSVRLRNFSTVANRAAHHPPPAAKLNTGVLPMEEVQGKAIVFHIGETRRLIGIIPTQSH